MKNVNWEVLFWMVFIIVAGVVLSLGLYWEHVEKMAR